MNMRTLVTAGLMMVGLLALAGCSTPASRIEQNKELFNTFAPDVQASIRQGKIDIGFTRDMVFMALGKPDRQYSRTTESGQSEIWSYVELYSTTRRQRIEGPFRVRDPQGGYRTVSDSMWVDVDEQHEYERLRVEFGGNRVRAIENVTR
jgi:outer membrane protein assembly factor BamE (lipoprotein component of BamABCDE complex)